VATAARASLRSTACYRCVAREKAACILLGWPHHSLLTEERPRRDAVLHLRASRGAQRLGMARGRMRSGPTTHATRRPACSCWCHAEVAGPSARRRAAGATRRGAHAAVANAARHSVRARTWRALSSRRSSHLRWRSGWCLVVGRARCRPRRWRSRASRSELTRERERERERTECVHMCKCIHMRVLHRRRR
jgi:hypothetical protein